MEALPCACSSLSVMAPGAADYEIGGGEAVRHVVDIFAHIEFRVLLQVNAFFLQQVGKPFSPLTVAVDVLKFPGSSRSRQTGLRRLR